ncbi:uncharacterized protein [Prorops nasuta]|uniref:uncharacterized protein isoform X2 n=1 Tax=Prorops nasuta TaxID=863751 RepID=UPI0034CDFF9C
MSDQGTNFEAAKSNVEDDLEQQCEDAVYEVCDARERFPKLCAKELAQSIKIKNEINMADVKPDNTDVPSFHVLNLTKEKQSVFHLPLPKDTTATDIFKMNTTLKEMSHKLDDLRTVVEQLEKEKTCETNKYLKNI